MLRITLNQPNQLDETKGPIGRPRIRVLPAIVVSWQMMDSPDPSTIEATITFSRGGVEIFRTKVQSSKYDDFNIEQDIATALLSSPIPKGSYALGQLGSNWILVRVSADSTLKKT